MSLDKKNVHILIIDDNTKNLQVALNILSQEGYHLLYAQDGEKGISLANENKIDLILLDVLMPNMDGYSVCQQLKQNPKTENIPIIFLTVKDEETDIIKGFECGGVDYVTKPFYTSILLKRVETHLRLKHLNDNLQREVEEKIEKIRIKDQIFFQQAKMASMGEMLANIAHQWRQPLGSINSVIIGLKSKLSIEKFDLTTSKGREECITHIDDKLSNIENYTNMLSHTIDDFRNFFKPNKERSEVMVSELISTSLNLLSANFQDSQIEIHTNLQNIKITTLENELTQVLLNILNNAKDALTKSSCQPLRLIMISTKSENNFLTISIKDSAGGIKEEIKEKIFDPYFTTKHQTNGTGIGLYMSKEIIEKHLHGKLSAKNIHFQYNNLHCTGAEFTISLPLES
jgi:C4-dicarboxylate-specific signal transduction histidine kinase